MLDPDDRSEFGKPKFRCPHCGNYVRQEFRPLKIKTRKPEWPEVDDCQTAQCDTCEKFSVWYKGRMVAPPGGAAPLPRPNLPAELRADYEEAREIVATSPRGAAALLRLVVQKLCRHLGLPGKDLNKDIGELVKQGVSLEIGQALDVVRVVGNESVHPGLIDLRDDPETAEKLFHVVNTVVTRTIADPKLIQALFDALPDSKKDQIRERDGNQPIPTRH